MKKLGALKFILIGVAISVAHYLISFYFWAAHPGQTAFEYAENSAVFIKTAGYVLSLPLSEIVSVEIRNQYFEVISIANSLLWGLFIAFLVKIATFQVRKAHAL